MGSYTSWGNFSAVFCLYLIIYFVCLLQVWFLQGLVGKRGRPVAMGPHLSSVALFPCLFLNTPAALVTLAYWWVFREVALQFFSFLRWWFWDIWDVSYSHSVSFIFCSSSGLSCFLLFLTGSHFQSQTLHCFWPCLFPETFPKSQISWQKAPFPFCTGASPYPSSNKSYASLHPVLSSFISRDHSAWSFLYQVTHLINTFVYCFVDFKHIQIDCFNKFLQQPYETERGKSIASPNI